MLFTYTITTPTGSDATRSLEVPSFEAAKAEIGNFISLVKSLPVSEFDFELDESTNHIAVTRRAVIGSKGADYTLVIETPSGVKSHTVPAIDETGAKAAAVTLITAIYGLRAEDFDITVEGGTVKAVRSNIVIGSKG